MKLLKPAPDLARDQLRAMAMVARAARNGFGRPQRAMLDAVQRVVLGTALEVDGLPPIETEELAAHGADAAQSRQAVRLMVALGLADGPPSRAQVDLITSFAEATSVKEPSVRVIAHLSKDRMLRFKLSFARHSHIRIYLRNTYRLLGGVLPVVRSVLRARGVLAEDTAGVARFRALEKLPEETLGHRFYSHCRREGLPFSGEKGGFPVGALFHDFTHVLAGYDTSPEGEMKAAAFQAGFTRDEDDFFTMLFAIVIHTAGINLAPFPMPALPGRIGQGDLAVEVFHALERGTKTVDLSDDWNFWDYVELPIEAAREKLGVPPLEPPRPVAA